MSHQTVIVAGLTRSGLSLTMQILYAGGYPCVGEPPAFEPYKIGTIPWDLCRGKAVKLVDSHHHFPPRDDYLVIRLHRDFMEQARSINKFLSVFGAEPLPISHLMSSFSADYQVIDEWANDYPVLNLQFERILKMPKETAEEIQAFVGVPLNMNAMRSVVVNRDPKCYAGMLELDLIS